MTNANTHMLKDETQAWFSSPTPQPFLPARRYASAGYRDRNVSVCLSVRLSVTHRYCVKTKKASGMISSPSDSPKTLSFLTPNFITKF